MLLGIVEIASPHFLGGRGSFHLISFTTQYTYSRPWKISEFSSQIPSKWWIFKWLTVITPLNSETWIKHRLRTQAWLCCFVFDIARKWRNTKGHPPPQRHDSFFLSWRWYHWNHRKLRFAVNSETLTAHVCVCSSVCICVCVCLCYITMLISTPFCAPFPWWCRFDCVFSWEKKRSGPIQKAMWSCCYF